MGIIVAMRTHSDCFGEYRVITGSNEGELSVISVCSSVSVIRRLHNQSSIPIRLFYSILHPTTASFFCSGLLLSRLESKQLLNISSIALYDGAFGRKQEVIMDFLLNQDAYQRN